MKKLLLIFFLLISPNIFSQYEILIDKYSTDEYTYPFIRKGMKIQFLMNNNPSALVVSEYDFESGKFNPIKAFYITEWFNNYNRDGYNWFYLREDTFGEFSINYNPKTKKATFADKYSRYIQKFTFISGENSIKNKVSSWQELYDKGLEIVNDKIKIVSEKITNNNNIVDDEIVKEFESIKSKLVYIPKVYTDYLENLKSENEKGKNNLIFEELVNITKSEFINSKIDPLYNKLNYEYKVKYSDFVWNFLIESVEKIDLRRLVTKSGIKSFLERKRKENIIDNSIIVFDKKDLNKGFEFIIRTSSFRYNIEKQAIVCTLESKQTKESSRNSYGGTNYFKNKFTKLRKISDNKLLSFAIKIKDSVEIKKLSNAENKLKLKKYLLDESKKNQIKRPEDLVDVFPFEDTFVFYNTIIKSRNMGKLTLTFEGYDLKKGIDIFVVKGDDKKAPAPNGEYRLEDKRRISISNGKVSRVREQSFLGQLGDAALEGAVEGIKN